MTREDVKKLFPEATDEQITSLINQNNSEVNAEKSKLAKYKDAASKAEELEKQLEELNNQGLSEVEKANKELATSKDEISKLNAKIALMEKRQKLADKGIVGEDADKLVGDDGVFDIDALGAILENAKKNAVAEYEKKKLDETLNPSGGSNGGKDQESNAEKLVKSLYGGAESNKNDVISNYIN